jgi:hypothetical protein
LHVEFHPHRFITRFNAIQKELEAREVVYIEDEDIEEEEGEDVEHVEGDEEHAEGDEKADEEQGEEETEQGKLAPTPTCQHELMITVWDKDDTHQVSVPLPPAQPEKGVTGKLS